MRGTMTAAVVAALLVPALVRAQEPVKGFDQLNTRLKVGDRIVVTDARGREHEGKILDLSASVLTLDSGGVQKLSASEVQLVQERQRDSLKNGALIGLGTGAALATAAILAECANEYCENEAAYLALGVAFYGGIGAAVGTGIDALIPGKKRVVYRRPDGTGGTLLRLVPVITPRAKGMVLSLSF